MESLTVQGDTSELERRKIEIEEKKVEIEFEKIRIEKLRAWTGSASTFGSLLVVAATIALGIWSQYEQAKLQHDIQDRQAKAQFELKAAEIVMSTENPGVTLNKAKALQSLFPQYLTANFAESFVPQSFARQDEIVAGDEIAKRQTPRARRSPLSNNAAAEPDPVFVFRTGSRPSYRKNRTALPRPENGRTGTSEADAESAVEPTPEATPRR